MGLRCRFYIFGWQYTLSRRRRLRAATSRRRRLLAPATTVAGGRLGGVGTLSWLPLLLQALEAALALRLVGEFHDGQVLALRLLLLRPVGVVVLLRKPQAGDKRGL